MDNLNKTISFVLGLVVVLVFFAVITGRINLKGKLPFLSKTTVPTPTLSISQPDSVLVNTETNTKSSNQNTNLTGSYNKYKLVNGKTPSTIPQTGSPTLLIPILISVLGGGLMLRKIK